MAEGTHGRSCSPKLHDPKPARVQDVMSLLHGFGLVRQRGTAGFMDLDSRSQ